MHICAEHLNKNTGMWEMNVNCFYERIGKFPNRIENLYFLWVVATRAVSKLAPIINDHPFCEGLGAEEELVKRHVMQVEEVLKSCPETFDETVLFNDYQTSETSPSNLKLQFRDSFRNISRIMDCVGCEKCKLWGKLQTSGLGTALKILFGSANVKAPFLTRMELVSLINVYWRISESVAYLGEFHKLMQPKKIYGELEQSAQYVGPSANIDSVIIDKFTAQDSSASLYSPNVRIETPKDISYSSNSAIFYFSLILIVAFGFFDIIVKVVRVVSLFF